MTRILLTYVLPLAMPTILYLCWVWVLRHRASSTGTEIPKIAKGGLFWSFVIGFVLMISGLAYIAMTAGVGPDAGKYQSPRYEDGKIIPPSYTK